ncbi:hypothetical protein ACFLR1_05370 [Bacteroidota bacterium]
MLKIDMHTHIMPHEMPDFAGKFDYGDSFMLNHIEPGKVNMMEMDQMRKYWLPWLVGMSAETSRAICWNLRKTTKS